jgi:hypothetical protein
VNSFGIEDLEALWQQVALFSLVYTKIRSTHIHLLAFFRIHKTQFVPVANGKEKRTYYLVLCLPFLLFGNTTQSFLLQVLFAKILRPSMPFFKLTALAQEQTLHQGLVLATNGQHTY